MSNLKEMPVRRWQCSDGCRWLERRVYKDVVRYSCGFWRSLPDTLMSNPVRNLGIEPQKRIEGPHTDEPTKLCPHFEKGEP